MTTRPSTAVLCRNLIHRRELLAHTKWDADANLNRSVFHELDCVSIHVPTKYSPERVLASDQTAHTGHSDACTACELESYVRTFVRASERGACLRAGMQALSDDNLRPDLDKVKGTACCSREATNGSMFCTVTATCLSRPPGGWWGGGREGEGEGERKERGTMQSA